MNSLIDISTKDGLPRSVIITGSIAARRFAAATSLLKSLEVTVDMEITSERLR